MKNMYHDLMKLNVLINKNNSSYKELQCSNIITENEFIRALKVQRVTSRADWRQIVIVSNFLSLTMSCCFMLPWSRKQKKKQLRCRRGIVNCLRRRKDSWTAWWKQSRYQRGSCFVPQSLNFCICLHVTSTSKCASVLLEEDERDLINFWKTETERCFS